MHIMPGPLHRRWYIPLTWFVSSIPIHVNVKLEVNTQGVFHRVSACWVTGNWTVCTEADSSLLAGGQRRPAQDDYCKALPQ
jgi:hypothetical protein